MSLNIPDPYNFLFKYICQRSFIWVWTSNILYYDYRLLFEICTTKPKLWDEEYRKESSGTAFAMIILEDGFGEGSV
jgi:hypothetical protein